MEEEYEPNLWERIEPTLYGLSLLLMNCGLVVSGLATLYLLYGLLGGGIGAFPSQTHDEHVRVLGLIAFAGKAMQAGLIAVGLGAGFAFRTDEATGYSLLGGAAALGIGVPYAVHTFAGTQVDNAAGSAALAVFVSSVYVPAAVGAILIVRDIVLRTISAVGDKSVDKQKMTYGTGAEAERLPVRTSLLAKCWEGGFCRDFIRPHCPIFIGRKTCWKERRGCYCEEDIVSAAAAKVTGVVLDMAPDPKYNFANAALPLHQASAGASVYKKPILSASQKRERCRNCVIFNQHEQEKYKILLPVTFIGGFAICAILSTPMRMAVDTTLSMTQTIINKASFSVGGVPQIVHPPETVEWIFVGAFAIMVVSKLLQALEWACFKAKI